MEEWDFVDERDLQNWKGGVVCMTCQHFTYGVDQHCHTMVGCNLRQKQLQQGQHLKKRCKLWAPTWQKEVGWAPEVVSSGRRGPREARCMHFHLPTRLQSCTRQQNYDPSENDYR